MAIKGVDPKCYILALFVREDGERFLLGSGRYVFKEKQQHFQANKMANDVIEVQGNDGYLLAGQVRRPGTQDFDGYVGDGTSSKAQVEQWRRDFFKFFRKNYLYKVIYVFSDGSAIQRKRGFLVDAPTVEELYQIYPEYHVALNFEDINYYFYNEDSDGHEIYGKSAIIGLTVGATGGLMWDSLGAISLPYSWLNPVSVSGTDIQINNQLSAEVPITDLQLDGDTSQQTYSGKNLYPGSQDFSGEWYRENEWTTENEKYNGLTVKSRKDTWNGIYKQINVEAGKKYTFSVYIKSNESNRVDIYIANIGTATATVSPATRYIYPIADWQRYSITFTVTGSGTVCPRVENTTSQSTPTYICGYQLEESDSMTDYEPYVGGTASPNPDYPQDINVVTGEQTVTVSDGVNSQDYTVNLTGKNLWPDTPYLTGYVLYSQDGGLYPYPDGEIYKQDNVTIGEKYTLTTTPSVNGNMRVMAYKADSTFIGQIGVLALTTGNRASVTLTIPAETAYIKWSFVTGMVDSQLELGEQSTAYTPYYNYELAKIGTYQDYIYKSGDDWYVHKATGKVVLDGSETWTPETTYPRYSTTINDVVSISARHEMVSDYFHYASLGNAVGSGFFVNKSLFLYPDTTVNTLALWQTWLSTHNTTVYYALATPTDTKITDATLIGELEGLEGMKLFIGENNVLVTASSTNLPAPLSFKYYTGINYDGAGFEWEAGGSGGDGMITVDSIDDVYPMLTIPGPVVNPTITNVTTGSVFQYTGTLSSTQTLEVDLMAKTAFLNGVSVIANVTSSSLYFKSGMNRVSYTTNNADAPDATIKWQEIVG